MTLALTIGHGPVALVQNGPIVAATGFFFNATLPLASTPGNLLILIVADATSGPATPSPAGSAVWSQDGDSYTIQGTRTFISLWSHTDTVGGITSVQGYHNSTASATYYAHLSEWTSVNATSVLTDWGGDATATAGTTLSVNSSSKPLRYSGDLAIAAWIQYTGASNTATFTTPAGWTRLADNGSTTATEHLDIEYQIGPPVGLVNSVVLTSNQTTSSAAGFVIDYTAVTNAQNDMTAYLAY